MYVVWPWLLDRCCGGSWPVLLAGPEVKAARSLRHGTCAVGWPRGVVGVVGYVKGLLASGVASTRR